MTLKTPKLHFDFVQQSSPEVRSLHWMMMGQHRGITDDDLRRGICSSLVHQLEGSPKAMAYHMMLFDRFGQNSYVVGPRVQDMFRRTDLSKITSDMLVAPQTSFYIALPECPWRIWGGDRTQWHEVQGIYVAFVDAVNRSDVHGDYQAVSTKELALKGEHGVQVLLWGGPNERSLNNTDDAVLWFSLNLEEWVRKGDDLETFFRHHEVMKADADNVDRWMGVDPADPFATPLIPEARVDILEQRETLISAMRLLFNLCLYIGSDEPELETDDTADRLRKEIGQKKAQAAAKKSAGKRKKIERQRKNLEEQLAAASRTRIVYVGPMFEDVAEKERREQTGGGGGSHGTPIEHAVRPHWQNYWVGSGDDRRRILRHKGMYRRGSGKPDRTIVKLRE